MQVCPRMPPLCLVIVAASRVQHPSCPAPDCSEGNCSIRDNPPCSQSILVLPLHCDKGPVVNDSG